MQSIFVKRKIILDSTQNILLLFNLNHNGGAMLNYLGSLICRWKGHRWSKAFNRHEGGGITVRIKHCQRCGLEREVKTRKTK